MPRRECEVAVVVTLIPDAAKPINKVVKTLTCPAGADKGYGMKVYEGIVSKPGARLTNRGTVPIAFAVGFLEE